MASARPARLVLFLVTALLTAAAVTVLVGGPANAAAYRYWGYFHGDAKGAWAFASTGGDGYKPADGAVEGWRYAVADETAARYPRAKADFGVVCDGTPAQDGKKRVAVYLDSGVAAEAPAGSTPPAPEAACVVLAKSATGADALAAADSVRAQKGLVCGIGGYPASGCGGEVKKPPAVPSPEPKVAFAIAGATPTPTPTRRPAPPRRRRRARTRPRPTSDSSDTGSNTVTYVLIAVVVALVLAGGGFLLARRNRS